jgi:hypothetical protein
MRDFAVDEGFRDGFWGGAPRHGAQRVGNVGGDLRAVRCVRFTLGSGVFLGLAFGFDLVALGLSGLLHLKGVTRIVLRLLQGSRQFRVTLCPFGLSFPLLFGLGGVSHRLALHCQRERGKGALAECVQLVGMGAEFVDQRRKLLLKLIDQNAVRLRRATDKALFDLFDLLAGLCRAVTKLGLCLFRFAPEAIFLILRCFQGA